ncbi:MAG: sigma 54-interacting transcriptional regulator, partial [candidate division Zixibacteria bacterium]|nr:sigma 54-interacting transcriptional regulator [candidate division Zixibacteria bacterium]
CSSDLDGSAYEREDCPIYAAFSDGEVHRVDDEVFWRKDGTSFAVEYVSTPIVHPEDGLVGAVVTFSDITERKAAEVALRSAMTELEELKDRLAEENIYLREEIKLDHRFEEIVGASPRLQKELRKIGQVAPTPTTVLILGETGTGKELFARAIHDLSDRRHRALVKVNCAALPAGIVESELFGHEKGAFTGAIKRRKGRFELAQSGSIFLDEIGDIPLGTQVKLLRVLQEKEFERVGGEETLSVDTRIIAATSKNLQEEIKRGNFREDYCRRYGQAQTEKGESAFGTLTKGASRSSKTGQCGRVAGN